MTQQLSWRFTILALVPAAILTTLSLEVRAPAQAHEGEQHGTPAPGGGASGGPVRLTEEGRRNLKLEVQEAQIRSLSAGPTAYGVVDGSARMEGRNAHILISPVKVQVQGSKPVVASKAPPPAAH